MLDLRYILIVVVSALIIIISLILLKYRKIIRMNQIEMSKDEVLGRLFLRKIRKMEELKAGDEPAAHFKKLNNTMREFFKELYDISYEFAYIELNEELVKKGIDEEIRDAVIDYNMRMAESEYGHRGMTEQEFHYLLGQSIKIIEMVTGHREEGVKEKLPEKKPEEKPEAVKAEKRPVPKKHDVLKPDDAHRRPPKKGVPEPVKPKDDKKLKIPKKTEEEMEKKILIPEEDDQKIGKIRRLLATAEINMKDKKAREAMDNYTDLRVIYDSLPPGVKIKINQDTKRIITLYNSLLSEYKDVLKK
jgi:hypothetical protein